MVSQLAKRLLELGYTELFQRPDNHAVSTLWGAKRAPQALKQIALNPEENDEARFLAAEVVLSRQPRAFSAGEREEIGKVYAAALRQQFTGSANEWSFPVQPIGRAGEHLLLLGPYAIPALRTLLDDNTPVIFEGSQEAMIGGRYNYRVKDLAAQFIAGIAGLPFPNSTDPSVRDSAIAAQKQRFG
jgi:hypothetical protein